jgi:hypothetical protein
MEHQIFTKFLHHRSITIHNDADDTLQQKIFQLTNVFLNIAD